MILESFSMIQISASTELIIMRLYQTVIEDYINTSDTNCHYCGSHKSKDHNKDCLLVRAIRTGKAFNLAKFNSHLTNAYKCEFINGNIRGDISYIDFITHHKKFIDEWRIEVKIGDIVEYRPNKTSSQIKAEYIGKTDDGIYTVRLLGTKNIKFVDTLIPFN